MYCFKNIGIIYNLKHCIIALQAHLLSLSFIKFVFYRKKSIVVLSYAESFKILYILSYFNRKYVAFQGLHFHMWIDDDVI